MIQSYAMYFVYILQSAKDHKMYIGYTTDLKQRMKKHNSGGVQSTQHRRPLKLIFFEGYISKADALRREEYFKTTAGKRALKLMLQKTFQEDI